MQLLRVKRNQLKFALTTGLLEERQEPSQSVKRTKLKRQTLLPSKTVREPRRRQLPNQREVLRPVRRERKRRSLDEEDGGRGTNIYCKMQTTKSNNPISM